MLTQSPTPQRGTSPLPDPEQQPLLDVPTAGAAVDWSRDKSYRAARDGLMPVVRIGRRVYVVTAEWRRTLGLDGGQQ